MSTTHVVFDNPPLEKDEWVGIAAQQLGLTLVDNARLAKAMGADPEMRKALNAPGVDPILQQEKLAPLYRDILEREYGTAKRRALYSSVWLLYGDPVDAFILDWSEVEKRATASNVPADQATYFRVTTQMFLRERMNKFIAKDRVLQLEAGLSPAEKVKRSVEFVKSLKI